MKHEGHEALRRVRDISDDAGDALYHVTSKREKAPRYPRQPMQEAVEQSTVGHNYVGHKYVGHDNMPGAVEESTEEDTTTASVCWPVTAGAVGLAGTVQGTVDMTGTVQGTVDMTGTRLNAAVRRGDSGAQHKPSSGGSASDGHTALMGDGDSDGIRPPQTDHIDPGPVDHIDQGPVDHIGTGPVDRESGACPASTLAVVNYAPEAEEEEVGTGWLWGLHRDEARFRDQAALRLENQALQRHVHGLQARIARLEQELAADVAARGSSCPGSMVGEVEVGSCSFVDVGGPSVTPSESSEPAPPQAPKFRHSLRRSAASRLDGGSTCVVAYI